MLRLADKWVWDFWFAVDGQDYHIFYLQADRALQDSDLRHWNVSVGHAVSRDLTRWLPLDDAIAPSAMPGDHSPEPADTYTTWTGSIIKRGSTWFMFYTGTKKSEKGLIQRVCLATSEDLIHWDKHQQNPLVELDARWYDGLNLNLWHDASWRDPWVIKDPENELYHMAVTCRVNSGDGDGRGAIGYACSEDLIHWTVSKPLLAPGLFGEMEVPQIEKINGRYCLFYSVSSKYHSAALLRQVGCQALTGVKYAVSDKITGPYRSLGDGFIIGDTVGSLYSGRVIKTLEMRWVFLGFLLHDDNGEFVGEISDPLPIDVLGDGRLVLA